MTSGLTMPVLRSRSTPFFVTKIVPAVFTP